MMLMTPSVSSSKSSPRADCARRKGRVPARCQRGAEVGKPGRLETMAETQLLGVEKGLVFV